MKRPLRSFIEEQIERDATRMYMPGHKGRGEGLFSCVFPYDITEIHGADYLYSASGVLREIEEYAAEVFGAGASLMSVGGSSQSIAAMVKLAVPPGGKLLVDRNCHISAIHAMALLGVEPVWFAVQSEETTGLARPLTAEYVKEALEENKDVQAVFLTSPDYFGRACDIRAIAEVCAQYSVKLLVDNAHGAWLHFLKKSAHPIGLGADFCCDSLHKTLPALTGTGLLHLKEKGVYRDAKEAMALFGSTSPSYLMMLSIEECLFGLENIKQEIEKMQKQVQAVCKAAEKKGLQVVSDNDNLRISISALTLGYTGQALGEAFRTRKIEPEYISDSFVVLLPGLTTKEEEYRQIITCIENLSVTSSLNVAKYTQRQPKPKCSLRRAILGESEFVSAENCLGRIVSQSIVRCPPGIAVVVPGEEIDTVVLEEIKKSGNSVVKVLK